MAIAQRQEGDLHTPVTHYEILSERLKDARIDRLEEVISEKFNTVHERIKSTNERIDSTRNELLIEIKSTNTRIDALDTKLAEQIKSTNTRIDSVENSLSTRIDSLEKSVNRGFVIIGVIITIASALQFFLK